MSATLQVVVGLGITGVSCVRFLQSQGIACAVTDSRAAPPNLDSFKNDFPNVPVHTGKIDEALLAQASVIIVSPGVSLREPAIARQIKLGKTVIGDVELFAKVVKSPVVGITGTNAKSSVTTLVGLMMEKAGYQTQTGGNLGVPVLDLYATNHSADVYVLELSSFQLETTDSLHLKVASVLNITPDHMDRYDELADYQKAKHRIYQHCDVAVCNRDDALTQTNSAAKVIYFTLGKPKQGEFGLVSESGATYLAMGDQRLLKTSELPVIGNHSYANALAALAIGHGFGLSMDPMLAVLRGFRGLPHRCQFVREYQQVKWYNDSKGTNVGATQAAIEGLGKELPGKLILIAGGIGKNADFRPMAALIEKHVRHAVLIGRDAKVIAGAIENKVPVTFANSMEEAVMAAAKNALPGDAVLLSPACASFDMFKHFEHRGDVFMEIVEGL